MFDGEEYTAFTLGTNPASDNALREYGEASTGVSVTDVHRDGAWMVIDVELPKWYGSISARARWYGTTDVIGDVVVEESGTLRLDPNTVVRFASGDASQGGMDPERCELVVKGRLELQEEVRFAGQEGARWLGIGLDTQCWISDMLTLLGSDLKDTERGIFYTEPWSGMYGHGEPLVWFGTVDVTGDVVIDAPLVVLPGTVVRCAPQDDQHGGVDPSRCELLLKRKFSIHGTSEKPIRFMSLSETPSDADWYGIALSERAYSMSIRVGQTQFDYGLSHYVVEHAQHGLFWDGHLGESRLVLQGADFPAYIWDGGGGTGRFYGNGDGQANAGEHLYVTSIIRNLSSQDVDSVFVSIATEDPFVRFCPVQGTFPCASPNIGNTLFSPWFGFTVASDAPAGHRILFRIDFAAPGIGGGQDTILVDVAEGLDTTPPYARVDVNPQAAYAGFPVHIRASVFEGGGIDRVLAEIGTDDEVVVDLVELHVVPEAYDCPSLWFPWGPRGPSLKADVFEGEWVVPVEGNFYVQIDAEDEYGNRDRSASSHGFSSASFAPSTDVVLTTRRASDDTKDPLAMRVLDRIGIPYDLWNVWYRGAMDSVAIAKCRGSVLIWPEDWFSPPPEQDRGFIAYLRGGGRLLICSLSPPYPEDELATYLGIERIPVAEINLGMGEGIPDDLITDGLTLNGRSYSSAMWPCYALLSFRPDAVPILRDGNGHIVGMRVERDGYRVVYFGVPFSFLGTDEEIQELVGRSLQWLQAPGTAVLLDEETEPLQFSLRPNHPNPFNATTVTPYDVAESGDVCIVIHNLLGQVVRMLVNGPVSAGHHTVHWDGRDEEGHALSSGVYLCKMEAGHYSAVRKVLLLR